MKINVVYQRLLKISICCSRKSRQRRELSGEGRNEKKIGLLILNSSELGP